MNDQRLCYFSLLLPRTLAVAHWNSRSQVALGCPEPGGREE